MSKQYLSGVSNQAIKGTDMGICLLSRGNKMEEIRRQKKIKMPSHQVDRLEKCHTRALF